VYYNIAPFPRGNLYRDTFEEGAKLQVYTFKNEIDYTGYCFMSKKIVASELWSRLSKAGKTVLPVIVKYSNKQGEAFPSQETIGIISGVTEKTVREGIKNIAKFTDMRIKTYRTIKGNISYKYIIPVSMFEAKGKIRINNALFDSGCWRELSASGKALYIVLRALAEHDDYDYKENGEYDNFGEWFGQRKYDIVKFQSQNQLAQLAGISRASIPSAVNSLRETKLFIDVKDFLEKEVEHQRIYIIPQMIFDRDKLNNVIDETINRKQKKL
jgi:Helix-turn-helix domain